MYIFFTRFLFITCKYCSAKPKITSYLFDLSPSINNGCLMDCFNIRYGWMDRKANFLDLLVTPFGGSPKRTAVKGVYHNSP